MLQLPHGCSCSIPAVSPKNWKTAGQASLKKPWYIQYYFRDPRFADRYKNGKLVTVKQMNRHHDLEIRKALTKVLLEEEISRLKMGFNPITKEIIPQMNGSSLEESTNLVEALHIALAKIDSTHKTKIDLRSVLKYTEISARSLRLHQTPISAVRRKHVMAILDHMAKAKKSFSNNTFNYYRAHLSMLFNELLQYDAIEVNPIIGIKKKHYETPRRKILTREERHMVDRHLKKKGLTRFRLLNRIFYHSGIRESEAVNLTGKDVMLADQKLRVTIRKRRKPATEEKTIKNIAVRYWKLALVGCGPDDYVFSTGLQPGKVKISPKQITRRWKRHVKDELGITADFYGHKHANTTEMMDSLAVEDVAAFNSHTSPAMVVKIYDTRQKDRQHERNKRAGNEF